MNLKRISRPLVLAGALIASPVGALLIATAATGSADNASVQFPGPDAPIDTGCETESCLDSRPCMSCHEEQARDFHGSLHQRSWTDPIFQESYAIEPRATCRHCHAPLAETGHTPSGLAAEQGVSCVACHVRGRQVFGARPSPEAPHPVRVSRTMSDSRFCAGCHQFDFPTHFEGQRPTGIAMQATFAEWQRSPAHAAQTQCQGCHMEPVDSSRAHHFRASTDSALLARAAHIQVERSCDAIGTVLTFRLRGSDALGHAFPTGDLFRSVELRVEADEGRYRRERRFQRHFRFRGQEVGAGSTTRLVLTRVPTEDTRIFPGETRVEEIRVPAGIGEITWHLDHLVLVSPDAPRGQMPRQRTAIVQGSIQSCPSDF